MRWRDRQHYTEIRCESFTTMPRSTSLVLFTICVLLPLTKPELDSGQCQVEDNRSVGCDGGAGKYKEDANAIYRQVKQALAEFKPCSTVNGDPNCTCHADVIQRDLAPYSAEGITESMIQEVAKFGTRYKILGHRLYRDANCMFPSRNSGIEHFLLPLLADMPDMDFVVNTRDWPQLRSAFGAKGPVFSFSKTEGYLDISYPAWTFWAGGPAISLFPTGIGRWDLLRERISESAARLPWSQKTAKGFFRGSRTSEERDSLVLLSRRLPTLVDAQYTKNQAWKSPKDTLNAEPAVEVSFEDHCRYKFLFNFRGVAASFRLKHLFLCKSLVFHVGDEWSEFFYSAMKPWVHYIPVKSYPSESDLEELLLFFREHDELAQQIASRGFDFIKQHLRMEDVQCYWRKLLLQYQSLLKYEVKSDESLVEVNSN